MGTLYVKNYKNYFTHYKLCTWNTILQAKQTDKQREPQRDKDERKREERERAQREWNISKREGEILKREEKKSYK